MCHSVFVFWFVCSSIVSEAAELGIGLVEHHTEGTSFTQEWSWALRGGGAQFKMFDYRDFSTLNKQTPLLIIDNVPLDEEATHDLEKWVHQGGLLIYAGASAALQRIGDHGQVYESRELLSTTLLGASFAGFDRGQIGIYPDIIESSALLNPLEQGDALRFGAEGVGHIVSVEATDAKVLARGVRLSLGPGEIIHKSTTPTILTKKHGRGRVVFLTFSPAQIASCYPDIGNKLEPTDCTGASQAHALMRWLVANLLWEERQLQLPLLWEAPGDRPHAVIVTGDVHNNSFELKAAVKMGKLLDELGIPLSLYIIGQIATDYPAEISMLQQLDDLEISPHSATGRTYWSKRFKLTGALGILLDLKKAERLLSVPDYPDDRNWLISVRNESWASDRKAWRVMEREGVGLVFDHTADATQNRGQYLAPRLWFDGGEQQRLFVPIFERSIATPVDDFRLNDESSQNIALLSSAQAEPCCIPLSYSAYTRYVARWHALFDRLAINGGLTEVWLWHPGGVALKEGFAELVKTLNWMKNKPTVSILRGDVVATWRFNRERQTIVVNRGANGSISSIDLEPPTEPIKAMPAGAPVDASSTSYWVLGSLNVPGWTSRHWTDSLDRTVSVLVHPL